MIDGPNKLSQDSFYNDFENLFSSLIDIDFEIKNPEFSLLNKNIDKYQSLNPLKFNIMVVGERGLGKTTFINCFLEKLKQSNNDMIYTDDSFIKANNSSQDKKTDSYISYKYKCLIPSQNFNIEIIDTPGYGSDLNIRNWLIDLKRFIKLRVN